MATDNVIRKGDPEWDRLFQAWSQDKKKAGWLVLGTLQYRVIQNDDDSVVFVPVTGNIDSYYGSMSQGVT